MTRTLIIDRTFRSVGRIKVATGTTIPAIRRRMSAMLTELHENGRLDLLRAIREGQLSLLEVYSAYREKGIDRLAIGPTAKLLAAAMTAWIDSLATDGPSPDCSVKHKESLETSRRYFERANSKATVADLPQVLEGLRESLGRKHPRSFNLARAASLAFIRSTLKRSHPLWLACAAVEHRRVKRATKRTPLSIEQMRNFFPKPGSDWIDDIAWSMTTSGMGGKELWGRWNVLPDRIHIEGTKTAHRTNDGRVRDVPLVMTPVVPRYNRRKFENDLRDRTRAITVYDLRRTYANWMEAAGIPRPRRKLYLGHGAGDVTGLYELHEVEAFLAEDAAKLKAFLNLPHTKGHTMRIEKGKSA